jgi:segregation and condensation protein B
MDKDKIEDIVEALIFSAPEPISTKKIAQVLEKSEEEVEKAISSIRSHLSLRPIELAQIAGGWRFQTKPEFYHWIRKIRGNRRPRLKRPSLITLAIIAYNQPITKQEVDRIRGVNSERPIENLLELGLIKIAGRKRAPGAPFLYKTTEKFLSLLGLADISHLPKVK